ncbi:TOX high mobility group box family member 4 [Microcaecilia unicolor]|uniref:TOX high mobility group box family member 4 n=1 Tax=Microcaecilia unicolor TaxID=1415580 RepID=A0A6P7WZI2_9AMPH|nr:TOX high mobility group box family member 4 [Microcaecilia unicolor]
MLVVSGSGGRRWKEEDAAVMEFPGGSDNYLTITGSGHPFLTGAETFHTPNLGDEEFELPPITLDADPTLAVSDVVSHFDDLGDPTHEGSFSAQYGVQTLELPVSMSHEVMEQTGGLLSSGFSMELEHTIGTQYSANPPVTIDVSMAGLTSDLLAHGQLTTIDQSELSSQLGLSLGAGAILPPVQSPEDRLSTTPSPTGSQHEDEAEEFRQVMLPKVVTVETGRKQKTPKKKKKKDPNEPQKPVSAYALFFRDTQAAIKGQNPNATFGEVSKIVASMWDSLGEEQKQVYKRKTEAAKKDYLKALAEYKANQLSQPVAEVVELEVPQPVQEPPSLVAESVSPSAAVVVTPTTSQYTPSPAPPASSPQPSISKIIICKQVLSRGQLAASLGSASQSLVTVIPANLVTSRGLQLQTAPAQTKIVTRSVLQAAMQMPPPRLQPPPLQQMPQIPPQQQPVAILQPPPLQAMQKLRLNLQPPPLQIKIIPPPMQPATTLQIQPQPIPAVPAVISPPKESSPAASPETPVVSASPPQHMDIETDVVPEVESPPASMEVQLISGSPPQEAPPSPQSRCVRSGCENLPVESKDWDKEYCSNECVVKHCRDVFLAWVAARSQGSVAAVK